MFDLFSKLTVSDKTAELAKVLKELAKMEAYVGIPESKSSRNGGKVNNAQLMFIHTNGSPLKNIPKRPVIEPAIEAAENKKKIADYLAKSLKALLDGNVKQGIQFLHRAGQAGEQAARDWFFDPRNNWPPNKLATVRAKLRRKYKTKKGLDTAIDAYLSGTPGVDSTLIDTADMRKSITHVIRER